VVEVNFRVFPFQRPSALCQKNTLSSISRQSQFFKLSGMSRSNQHSTSPGNRASCYAELAISTASVQYKKSSADARESALSDCIVTTSAK